jgi:glucose/mannose-6-phosphate isomerase
VVDVSGMAGVIEGLPLHLREGAAVGAAAGARLERPSAVVIAGMGGSAIGGELLRAMTAADCPVPITRVRGFGIPVWAGPGTLVVCASYSGNTEETLACAHQAHRQRAGMLCIGAGGELVALAEQWGVPLAPLPGGLQPRAALGYLFGALASAFEVAGLAQPGLTEQAAVGAELVDRDAARELGRRVASTVPLVYGTGALAAVAYRWKTQINENAKLHAFSHAFPELDHNEICGWEGAPRGTFSAIMLRDADEHPGTARRIEVTAELLEVDAAFVAHVRGRGETRAASAFSLLAHGDWVSYEAALARGVDPTPVERIGVLKQRLSD